MIDEVARLTGEGWRARRIAEHLGLSMRTVFRYRSRAGVTRPRCRPLTDGERWRAQCLLEEGYSVERVARTLHRAPTHFRRLFPDYVWTKRQAIDYALEHRHGSTD